MTVLDSLDAAPPLARTATDVDAHVGRQLRTRRAIVGLSQSQLGDQLGVTFQQVQKYERGQNRIAASMLFRAARVLQCPVEYFYAGLDAGDVHVDAGDTDADRALRAFALDHYGLRLARAFASLHTAQRRPFVELMESIAEVQVVRTEEPADAPELAS